MKKTKTNILLKNKKVLVGISGGVDSSVSAILLKEAGYEVEGVFAKVWQPDFIECTWRDEMKDAMRVCARLDIPFHFLDLENEYKEYVGDYMIREYQSGRTPNPDVMCNTHIKFGFIFKYAIDRGFDFVATGHYAQNIDDALARGLDNNKDQSYFLWNVNKDKLKNILFPVGGLKKDRVREIAKRHGLFTAEKKDSQGLCFIGPIDMKSFLKQLIKTEPGRVLDSNGVVIGEHEGAVLYTIGERHGFTIYPEFKQAAEHALYVVDKNMKANTITVDSTVRKVREVELTDTNFLSDVGDGNIEVQFRYRQKPLNATLNYSDGRYSLVLRDESEFIAVGQSAVFYRKNTCIGGGIVDKVIRA